MIDNHFCDESCGRCSTTGTGGTTSSGTGGAGAQGAGGSASGTAGAGGTGGSGAGGSPSQQQLEISANGRFFATPDGSPFIWLGDTLWRWDTLTPPQMDYYLGDASAPSAASRVPATNCARAAVTPS